MTNKTKKQSLDAVKSLQATGVVNEIGTLQVSIQSTLSNISAAITGKLEQLSNTEEAISSMEDRLRELYAIEKEALIIEAVKADRIRESDEFTKEVNVRQAEMAEFEANRNKKWQREEEERNYEFTQRRRKALDDHNSEVENHKRAEHLRIQDLIANWDAREAVLKDRETEFTNLKNQVTSFDEKLKTEISKAEAIVGNTLKKSYEHQMELLKRDRENEKLMFESKIESLRIQIGQMHEQNKDLITQLQIARNDAKEVTSQALQSASGRQVADALARVVDSGKDAKSK